MLQDAPRMAHPLGNSVSAKASCFLYSASWPNATAQPLPKAEATQERTLEAVGCSRLFGKPPASCVPDPGVPRTPIGSPHLPGAAGMGAS
jgi:hypothetical protein